MTLAQSTSPADKHVDNSLIGDFGDLEPAQTERSRIISEVPTMRFVAPSPIIQGDDLNKHHENERYPSKSSMHYNRAVWLYEHGYLNNALLENRAALDIDENFSQAWCNIGGIYSLQKLTPKAVEAFNQALKTSTAESPGRVNTLQGLAGLYVTQGALEKAETLYKEAITIGPAGYLGSHYADTILPYASLLRKMHRVEESEEVMLRASQIRASESAK